ncbi:GNAT family acetyltransferase [Hahella sp. KA22]|uniref:GNAT family acetyltransferase n=1 Tax=Hahella sp. KA22 TaxID=1628392 RepID=UPI000FDD412F|nr:GNAT family acetyltransferase [Hahella sp. KA22]AZZ95251.1 GNAT family acetyltransferase [Hahella sp. KA22]QAY52896.1 GNAT family acetyltransferase [Hahella sp. KA22]
MVTSNESELIIRTFQWKDEHEVVVLWEKCGLVRPWNDPRKDIHRKLEVGADLFLVGEWRGRPVATVMGGYEGHRGWVNYLAVDPQYQGSGWGRALMDALQKRLLALGCPKINLQIRKDNLAAIGFYTALGYLEDQSISMGKRLIPD